MCGDLGMRVRILEWGGGKSVGDLWGEQGLLGGIMEFGIQRENET